MKTWYFVGGPLPGHMDEFRRRLGAAGGPPHGWSLYPHASGDGLALHVVRAETREAILGHLALFEGIYRHGEITEVVEVPPRTP
jgi:hypothetical protein